MVILGIRARENEKSICRCYDSDAEYCTIDSLCFDDVRTVLIRKENAQQPTALCASFSEDILFFTPPKREIIDLATGQCVGTFRRKISTEAFYNERYLFRKDGQTVRVWDLTRSGDPVAAFSLNPLGPEGEDESVSRFVFLCEDTLPEPLRLAFLLYPSICFS